MTLTPEARKNEWLLLLTLAAVQFTHVLDFVIMMPLGPQFMRAFDIGPSEFGWMISAYTFSAAVFGLLGALFVDRFDRKPTLLALYAGFTLGTLLCAIAPSHQFFIFARAFAGAFGGIMGATVLAIVGDAIPLERRGRAMGTVMSAFSVASIIGVPAGLFLANLSSWHAPFYALAGLSTLVWLVALRALPSVTGHLMADAEGEAGRARASAQALRMLLSAEHWRSFALTICLMFAGFSVIPYLSPYLVANAGVTEAQLPLVYLAGGSCTIFTSRIFGAAADRWGAARVFTVISLFSCIPIWVVTHLGHVPLALALTCTSLFMILVSGRFIIGTTLITSTVTPRERGGFMSVNGSIQSVGSGSASLVAGWMITKAPSGAMIGYDRVGYLALACTVGTIALARRLRIRR